MKTKVLENIISTKELAYIYKTITSSFGWRLNGSSTMEEENYFFQGPSLLVFSEGNTYNDVFNFWGQSLVYRIAKLLKDEKIGIPTQIQRMWFNVTYQGKKTQHKLHVDDSETETKSILLFLTPIWQPDWRGSFFVDGEEFKFKPGSAVIFDSSQYHQGESPISETYNWLRLTCNILVK